MKKEVQTPRFAKHSCCFFHFFHPSTAIFDAELLSPFFLHFVASFTPPNALQRPTSFTLENSFHPSTGKHAVADQKSSAALRPHLLAAPGS